MEQPKYKVTVDDYPWPEKDMDHEDACQLQSLLEWHFCTAEIKVIPQNG